MNPLRKRIIFSIFSVFALAGGLLAQTANWGSAAEVDLNERGTITGTVESVGGDSFEILPDSGRGTTIRVTSAATTRFTRFGAEGESVSGSAGLNFMRAGDRVRVEGVGIVGPAVRAETVALIGRPAAAPGTAPSETILTVEGVIDSILPADQSFTLRGDDGQTWTIVGTDATPVIFKGEKYRLQNLETGDRVRVDVDSRLTSGELRAGRIEVLVDATPDEEAPLPSIAAGNFLTGRVGRIEARGARFVFRSDRAGEVMIDAGRAVNAAKQPFRIQDIQVGDRLRIWGEYTGQRRFRADRIEPGTAADAQATEQFRDRGQEPYLGFSPVIFYGTVERNPPNEDRLTIRDRDARRSIEIVVDEEFVVLRTDETYLRASQLRQGDDVVIKAFRDPRGEYIAQTIRLQQR